MRFYPLAARLPTQQSRNDQQRQIQEPQFAHSRGSPFCCGISRWATSPVTVRRTGIVFCLGLRRAEADLLGGGQLRLRAQRRQKIDQLIDAARQGDGHAYLSVGVAIRTGPAQLHLAHLKRRSLLRGHAFDHLQELRLRLIGGVARDQSFFALAELDRRLLRGSLPCQEA